MKAAWWHRYGVIAAVLLLGTANAWAKGVQLLVSNVQAQQRPGTTLVDVTYDLETIGDLPVWVSLFLSTDSGASYPNLCHTVSGDVGSGVLPGTVRHIVWDAATDFPGFSSTTCRLRVTADDAPNLAAFAYIPPGTFDMGSPTTELTRLANEALHQVTLTHGFYAQGTEVTNQQYMELAQWAYDNGYATATASAVSDNMDGSTRLLKSLGSGTEMTFTNGVFSCVNPDKPVLYATWYGAAAFCDWLSLRQGLTRAYSHATWQCNAGSPYTAAGYRLPTEAEWEYACRAGSQTTFNTGSCLVSGTDANFDGLYYPYPGCPSGTQIFTAVPVGTYPANGFGLHEMHGNVAEWCNDWYGNAYGGTVTNPTGPGSGGNVVIRGGDWSRRANSCRSAARGYTSQIIADYLTGFRPVRSAN